MSATIEISRSEERIGRTVRPVNHAGRAVPIGSAFTFQVITTQTTRDDGTVCHPSYSVTMNGEHQFGGPARFLNADGWPTIEFVEWVAVPDDDPAEMCEWCDNYTHATHEVNVKHAWFGACRNHADYAVTVLDSEDDPVTVRELTR